MSFKILCIDGGGVRGIYPAYLLMRIEESFNVKINEVFEMVVGTSTGSIIAGAIAIDYPLKDVVNLFEEKSKDIFKKSWFSLRGAIKSKYKQNELEEILHLVLGSRTLSETKIRLVIPATDIVNGNVHVFKSNYLPEFVRDINMEIANAILASCAAPTFFDPKIVGESDYLLADGGLWANNPSMVGLTEAIGKLGIDKKQVKLLSVGTGVKNISYDLSEDRKRWGIKQWGGTKLIDLILYLQSVNDTNQAQLILGNNYLRINRESNKKLALDNAKILADMKNRADFSFTHNSDKIKNFLEIE